MWRSNFYGVLPLKYRYNLVLRGFKTAAAFDIIGASTFTFASLREIYL
jgi:hypothetical protein